MEAATPRTSWVANGVENSTGQAGKGPAAEGGGHGQYHSTGAANNSSRRMQMGLAGDGGQGGPQPRHLCLAGGSLPFELQGLHLGGVLLQDLRAGLLAAGGGARHRHPGPDRGPPLVRGP